MTTDPVSETLSVHETDNTFILGSPLWSSYFRDRLNYDRPKILNEAINAWRNNPIAKRIIEITSEFVLGDGFGISCENPRSLAFLNRFWKHELNDLDSQLKEWADEAWRTGDLFILFSIDAGGFPLVRAVPAENISEIVTAPNDYRQEIAYKRNSFDQQPYPAYGVGAIRVRASHVRAIHELPHTGLPPLESPSSFMLHFPLNRAVGASFGESDLAPVLEWIGHHKKWLEDRIKLNHYRQVFSYVVCKDFKSDAEKQAFSNELTYRNPKQGSVLLTQPGETWSVLSPQLASGEANEDGLALKRMIATGAGLPLHYLGEPESSTRTTADAAGTPTFKRFKSRQKFLQNAVTRVLTVALAVYRTNGGRVPLNSDFTVTVPDITERDNAVLAIGVQRIVNAFAPLYNARLVDSQELIRIVYRFLGEVAPQTSPAGFVPVDPRPVAGRPLGLGKEENVP
jgi:hypothetical protein